MTISPELIAVVVFTTVVILFAVFVLHIKIPKRLKSDKFAKQWKELQSLCKDRSTWPEALTQADQLLDKALKKRRYKGKSMGERMVSAQKVFTDNDAVWFAHNLYKKVKSEEIKRLKESDVKDALIGFRQALRDIGALKSDKPGNS